MAELQTAYVSEMRRICFSEFTTMACKVCKHPKRAEIEQKIAARTLTNVEAARIVGCHNSTISRHISCCVAPNVREWLRAEAKERQSVNVLDQLRQREQVTSQILEAALSEADYGLALKTLGIELQYLKFKAKLMGELNEAPQVNFVLSPEFIELRQVMMRVLEPHPELREEAAQALLEMDAANKGAGNEGNGKK